MQVLKCAKLKWRINFSREFFAHLNLRTHQNLLGFAAVAVGLRQIYIQNVKINKHEETKKKQKKKRGRHSNTDKMAMRRCQCLPFTLYSLLFPSGCCFFVFVFLTSASSFSQIDIIGFI